MEQGFLNASSVVEIENIPYLRTEDGTLVFTIAPNGHIWGHRIEDGGDQRDIELEIFSSKSCGYTLRKKGDHSGMRTACDNHLKEGQKKAVKHILAQRESFSKILKTILLPESSLYEFNKHYKGKSKHYRNLNATGKEFENISLIDCSFAQYHCSQQGFFFIEYLDKDFVFEICGSSFGTAGGAAINNVFLRKYGISGEMGFSRATPKVLGGMYRDGYRFVGRGTTAEFPHYVVFAAQAEDKKFYVGHFPACVERGLIPNEITVLCDINNIFDCFEIDDAMLLLEEKRLSETESELYWTLAIAHNKFLHEHRRIKSNNSNA